MKISELFYSIQGEGKRTGVPSFFIRTNHCNLRCRFSSGNLCDTSYTSWFPNDKKNLGNVSIDFILREYKKTACNDVVITGGEPTMYPDELEMLCKKIKAINKNAFITIESNGTYFGKFTDNVNLMSISPKLKSSVPYKTEFEKMHEKSRIKIEVFKKYASLKKRNKLDIQWKFVFTSEKDLKEIKELQKKVGIFKNDIYLMPEGITESQLEANRLKTIEACKKNKFNYSDRLHIIAWGNKRGT